MAAGEKKAQADMITANRGPAPPSNVGEYNFLHDKLGLPQDEALGKVYPGHADARAFGEQPWYNDPLVAGTPGAIAARKKAETAGLALPMSDALLNMLADQGFAQGAIQWPGMSAAATAQRTKIGEREVLRHPNPDLAGNKAAYGADQASLKALQGNYDQTKAFGATAEKNSKLATDIVDSIPNLGIRYGNSLGRWAASQAGSPEVAKFHAAMGVMRPEFNRILQFAGTGGSMRLSDQQEKDVRATLGDDFTPAQLRGALSVYFQDRDNKLTSYADQINAIKARIHTPGGQPQGSGQTIEYNYDAQGNLVPVSH